MRYGLVVTGSCFPDDLVNRLDIAVIKTASRRINAASLSTRIEILHFLSGAHFLQNVYIQHCALFVHRTLQTPHSAIETRGRKEIGALLRVEEVPYEVQLMRNDQRMGFIVDPAGLPTGIIEKTVWQRNAYTTMPQM